MTAPRCALCTTEPEDPLVRGLCQRCIKRLRALRPPDPCVVCGTEHGSDGGQRTRGACRACYVRHQRAGTLDALPLQRDVLTPFEVVLVRLRAEEGVDLHDLAAEHGVSRLTVWRAVTGRTWSSVPPLAHFASRVVEDAGGTGPANVLSDAYIREQAIEMAREELA